MARNEPFSALDDVIQTFNAVTKRRMWKGKIAFTPLTLRIKRI